MGFDRFFTYLFKIKFRKFLHSLGAMGAREEEHFIDVKSKKERNAIISSAYLDGYSQIEIANYLGLSKSLISKIIKSGDSTAGV